MKKSRKKPLHPYLVQLGAELRQLRNKKRLSLESVGAAIGLDASNMQKIELGKNLTLNTLLKLCICLEITPAKIFESISWNLNDEDIDALTTPRPIKKVTAQGKK